jgi:DNA-binding MarR family transcriptional regulator
MDTSAPVEVGRHEIPHCLTSRISVSLCVAAAESSLYKQIYALSLLRQPTNLDSVARPSSKSTNATRRPNAAPKPLNPAEEAAWRAFARAILVLPRVLEAELLETHNLNLAEYSVLMNLSEHPDQAMRMNELADAVALSDSGLTRVVERLSRQGLVTRVRCEIDARGQIAHLTDAGFARLEAAYPRHLEGVRRHVVDHLTTVDLGAFAEAVGNMTAGAPRPPARRSALTVRSERE